LSIPLARFQSNFPEGTSFLATKLRLLQQKKLGLVFFEEDITILTSQDSIIFYHSFLAPQYISCGCFPIPKEKYFSCRKDNKAEFLSLLTRYHHLYYHSCEQETDINLYSPNPYVGLHFVWFFPKAIARV
jgi:hypothetical protein